MYVTMTRERLSILSNLSWINVVLTIHGYSTNIGSSTLMYFDLPYTKCNFILTYVVLAKNTYIHSCCSAGKIGIGIKT